MDIYTGALSMGGFVGPMVSFTHVGQRSIVIDRRYADSAVWEVRAEEVIGEGKDKKMMIGARRINDLYSRWHFVRHNPIPLERKT